MRTWANAYNIPSGTSAIMNNGVITEMRKIVPITLAVVTIYENTTHGRRESTVYMSEEKRFNIRPL